MRTCSVESCDNKHVAKGLCIKHYKYNKRRDNSFSRVCSVKGCTKVQEAKGLCIKHYTYNRRHGEGAKKVCSVEACGNNHHAKAFCYKHWNQVYRHGRTYTRTRYDLNAITCENGICTMQLYDKKQNNTDKVLFDEVDLLKVQKYKWCRVNGYVGSRICGKITYLHKFLFDCPKDREIDHRKRNPLDNRRTNLRVCNHSENCANRPAPSSNTTGFKGVYLDRRRQKYVARIKVSGKMIYLGQFSDALQAGIAYAEASIKYCGEFAYATISLKEKEVCINV